jgi:hypothetical protein
LRLLREQGIEDITILDKDDVLHQQDTVKYITGDTYLDTL